MAKKSKSIDLKQETADITAKITASYEKLAGKFRLKAQRAAEKARDVKGGEKESCIAAASIYTAMQPPIFKIAYASSKTIKTKSAISQF